MTTYKLQKVNPETNLQFVLKNYDTGNVTFIPFMDDNTDYAEYKAWVDAGNTAEAAD